MSDIVRYERALIAFAGPRVAGVRVRAATVADVPFMDQLQKLHNKQVGWMPTKQFEGHVEKGNVLIAEQSLAFQVSRSGLDNSKRETRNPGPAQPIGYCIGVDRYFKRDDVGVIYQMNVQPGVQRGLVGATLLKAMFERSAWGCKLFCCWCAQDIEANYFWEAMGFVPLAFRTGSAKRSRIHIFWQKRIRRGDAETPWWFPSQTGSGAIREDRIVLPIPPGTHWRDAKPMVLPGVPGVEGEEGAGGGAGLIEGGSEGEVTPAARPRRKRQAKAPVRAARPEAANAGGLWFGGTPEAAAEAAGDAEAVKPKRVKKAAVKNDPRLVAAARELRDRWLEEVNAGRCMIEAEAGKYEVSKAVEAQERAALAGRLDGVAARALPAA
ncbi:hypothetical protein ACERK3_10870 [Phycisphaerales bacterium AB-hyl4]|uniref:N-acetyltransferase domain-containing protein n=1 Tax=Natronomicrosphaera hydrolytica TaxID=3242702 RepID=A0ABV4U5D0_9BACT